MRRPEVLFGQGCNHPGSAFILPRFGTINVQYRSSGTWLLLSSIERDAAGGCSTWFGAHCIKV